MIKTTAVWLILSVLFMLWIDTTTATYQLVAAAAGRGNDYNVSMNKKCSDKDRRALLDFKALLQDPYDSLSTWGIHDEDDCCKWLGVTCNNQTGHVTELDLEGLIGELSHSLLNLTDLTVLDLSYNSFNGIIPMSIGSLTKLTYLDLSQNSFNGIIPMSIGSLTKLTYLDLSFNYFSGIIPMSIGSLTKLTYLDLSQNSFNGIIFVSIGSLTELTNLHLSQNYFNGIIPMSIGSLTKLTYLDLSENSFNGIIPISIGSLTKLTYLDLSENSFNGIIPMFIGSLTNLTYLHLSFNNFSGIIPPEFGNLTKLEQLYLANMGRCSVGNLDWLSHLSHLRELQMDGVSLDKANHWVNIVSSLQDLTTLSLMECNLSQVMHPYSSSSFNSSSSSSSIIYLYLRYNNLNSSISHWLFPLTSNSLVELDLTGNKLDGIPKYLGNLCSLQALYLNGNSVVVNFSDFLSNLNGCTAASLSFLDASSGQFTGMLSDDIQNFSSLQKLDLAHNQLNGISEKVWELPLLKFLDVASNSLSGALSVHFEKPKSNLSSLLYLDLSSCKLEPHFPKWVCSLENLISLNIASNGISNIIPLEFWYTWPSQLTYLNLSSNNISGKIPDLSSNFDTCAVIDLSSNDFYGPVSNVSSNLVSLSLSNNRLCGGISFLCQIVGGLLKYLDLSNNSFSGQLPDCLWHFQNLNSLNLGDNNFTGRLPFSVEYLISLEVLYLYNNKFSGELPLSLRNCTKLVLLDLGVNKFSGYVPVWIGEISGLYVLRLTSNNLFGPIPLQICQLVKLQILDLSINSLNGTIPSCVNNFTVMVQEQVFFSKPTIEFSANISFPRNTRDVAYADHAIIQWQGIIREFRSNLRLLKSIDLSRNNLIGQIPNELTDLRGLVALNLSKNTLVGEIPRNISQMKDLQIVDLSRNNLSGGLPSKMSQMNFLNYIDMSYNNFSGRIPSSTQFQTSDPSRYNGNPGLCGPPVEDHCPGDKELEVSPPAVGESQGDGEDRDELRRFFYIGGTTGFAIGFWIICSALLVNRRGRHTFFQLQDSLEDWIYVKVMVFRAKFSRATQT